MISRGKRLVEWDYFLSIEEDFMDTFQYVEPCEMNMDVHSIRFAKILLAAASETDTVLKRLCKTLDGGCSARSEQGYRNELILRHGLPFSKVKVVATRYCLEMRPCQNWAAANPKTPYWWTAYNKVKHQLDANCCDASLRNAFRSLCGLFAALLFPYEAEGVEVVDPAPKLLMIGSGIPVRNDMMIGTAQRVLIFEENRESFK